ncbi:MAG: substrate-binding domain-containing protein [Aeromicrobium sp.]
MIRKPQVGRARSGFVLALVGVALFVAACTPESASPNPSGGSAVDPNETYYWISQGSTIPIFVNRDIPAAKAAAAQLGVKLEVAGPTDINLSAFQSTIDQVCGQKPAGVMIVGWDAALAESINKCVAAGVPTVTVDADIPASNRMAFVGTSWYGLGTELGKAMVAALPNGGDVATLSILSAPNMIEAVDGFKAALAGSGINVVIDEDDTGEAAPAATKMAALLAAYPNLAGVAGFDSGSGPGIVQALREAGKAPGEIKVVSNEGATPDFFKNLQTGEVQAITVQKRELFTYYGMQILFDFNHSPAKIYGMDAAATYPIPRNIDTGLAVFTKDTADEIVNATAE